MASVPQKRLFLILSLSYPWRAGPSSPYRGLPEASICISVPPPGKPQRLQDPDSARAPNLPVLPAPHPARGSSGLGHLAAPPSHSRPILSLPKGKRVPSPAESWCNLGSAAEVGTQLPPPDPQRRALTELLCPSGPLGSGGSGGYSAARRPGQGAERIYLSSSAGPPSTPRPRLHQLPRPVGRPQPLPRQRRATVT